jgi:hypothetical protein
MGIFRDCSHPYIRSYQYRVELGLRIASIVSL